MLRSVDLIKGRRLGIESVCPICLTPKLRKPLKVLNREMVRFTRGRALKTPKPKPNKQTKKPTRFGQLLKINLSTKDNEGVEHIQEKRQTDSRMSKNGQND